MRYLEVVIACSSFGTEAVSGRLMELDVQSLVVDDPFIDQMMEADLGPSELVDEEESVRRSSRTPTVTVYLEYDEIGKEKAEEIERAVGELKEEAGSESWTGLPDPGPLDVQIRVRDDAEWKDEWKAYFKPFRVSDRIVVKPGWEKLDDNMKADVVLEIDPGMAFGTGSHETTSMCLQALEAYVREGDRVLDVGSGSGILSVAAAKLGAGEVLGIDIDDDAVRVMRENLARNDVENKVKALKGDLTDGIDFTADIVAANLLTHIVLLLCEDILRVLRPGGIFITSGILADQSARVTEKLTEIGFEILEKRELRDWVCIVAKRKAQGES